jgi:hypothetical protein
MTIRIEAAADRKTRSGLHRSRVPEVDSIPAAPDALTPPLNSPRNSSSSERRAFAELGLGGRPSSPGIDPQSSIMVNMETRTRRSEAERIADLERKIADLKARAERKKARTNPSVRHTVAAVRSIDKALATTQVGAVRQALDEARATLSACLAVQGVVPAAGSRVVRGGGSGGARRSSADVASLADELLAHLEKHPGQRGEEIAAALETDTRTIRLPLKKLIEDNKVKTKGVARGTSYHLV